MFEDLLLAIQDLNHDAKSIRAVLDALNLDYIEHERVYTHSLEVWFHITENDFTTDDMLALTALVSRLRLSANLTHNQTFLLLKLPLAE